MVQPRRMLVLRAVIEDYIRSQEPVGSSSLTRHHDLGVSSATVRNDMAALEDEGYLVQPHTSAGRIPTERGYRYFVDRLSTVMPLSIAQRRGISSFLENSVSLQDTLQRAARILSNITGQVAVVSSPSLSRSTLRHIEIVPLSATTLLAVIITDSGSVAQHTLEVTNILDDDDELLRFSTVVNEECSGNSLIRAASNIQKMSASANSKELASLAASLSNALAHMARNEQTSDLYMAGASRLAHQQQAMTNLTPLFDALEEQVVLMKLMSAMSEEHEGVGVAIGSETHTPGLINASVVASGYGHSAMTMDSFDAAGDALRSEDNGNHGVEHEEVGNQPVAFVGSIGPTHMNYSITMAAVRAVARYLTVLISYDDGER
jgi:heat-inducible transcriptional repressor